MPSRRGFLGALTALACVPKAWAEPDKPLGEVITEYVPPAGWPDDRIYYSRPFDPASFEPPETIIAGPLKYGDEVLFFSEKATYRLVTRS